MSSSTHRKSWFWLLPTLGLLFGVLFVLPGCSRGCSRVDNPCNWPDTCEPHAARVMLDEILAWAEEEGAKTPPHILLPDLDRIREDVPRCKKPDLKNGEGKHVCDVIDPKACAELQGIHATAKDAWDDADPGSSEAKWKLCADGLDQFPGGR